MTQRLFGRIDNVVIENVTKSYGDFFAVKDLNLTIEGGKLIALVGPSGSGKTTTLRLINKLIEPDKGSIRINNEDIKDLDPVKLRRNIGYVIQEIGLFPHMNVLENIGIIPQLEGWNNEDIKKRAEDILNLFGLSPELFIKRYPKELSGGQQQRIGLARAIMMNPPLLLMDEPFGALDPILRRQLQEEFLKIKMELGRTIVFVTHDINEAFKLGDRVAIMKDSKLIQIGEPDELILNPANDFVSEIVDSDKKFKHVDNLRVKDIMDPIDKKYLFDSALNSNKTIEEMKKRNVELALVLDKGRPFGVVYFSDLINLKDRNLKIGEITKKIVILSANDGATNALLTLKKNNCFHAIVTENENIVGILLPNEVLLKLV
ncbi:MAG: ABC transporter ATP-binding protein [Candidatus Methanofastidiosum sp.]|nr:ABC transporter ATP-binding protein [Methanofastidiosum sp.]